MSVTTVEDAYCRQVMPTADKKCQTYVHEKCQPNEAVNGCYALCKLTTHAHKRKMASQVMRQLLKSAVNTLNVFICSYEDVMSYKYKIFMLRSELFLC